MARRLLTLLAETPVHAGGAESLAAVDLPIQREAGSALPVIWGHSLKGALRQAWRDAGLPDEEGAFGSPPPGGGEAGGELTKGSLSIGDAQLVLLPAATLREVFAWATSPPLLSRLVRKIWLLGVDASTALDIRLAGGSAGSAGWQGRQVIGPFLENIRAADAEAKRVGGLLARLVCPEHPAFDFTRAKMTDDVLALDQDAMTGLARMGTEVVARVQLKADTKSVKNLFYSEYLPAETVLAAVLAGSDTHLDRLVKLLDGQPMQLGGDETVGRGVLWCRLHDASSLDAAVAAVVSVTGVAPPPTVPASQPPAPQPAPTPPAPTQPPATRPPATRPPGARPSPAAMPGRKRG